MLEKMWEKRNSNTLLCVCAQSCSALGIPMNCSRPDSFVHRIFQAGILEWVVISFLEDLPDPGIKPTFLSSPALVAGFFTIEPLGKSPTHCWWECKLICGKQYGSSLKN